MNNIVASKSALFVHNDDYDDDDIDDECNKTQQTGRHRRRRLRFRKRFFSFLSGTRQRFTKTTGVVKLRQKIHKAMKKYTIPITFGFFTANTLVSSLSMYRYQYYNNNNDLNTFSFTTTTTPPAHAIYSRRARKIDYNARARREISQLVRKRKEQEAMEFAKKCEEIEKKQGERARERYRQQYEREQEEKKEQRKHELKQLKFDLLIQGIDPKHDGEGRRAMFKFRTGYDLADFENTDEQREQRARDDGFLQGTFAESRKNIRELIRLRIENVIERGIDPVKYYNKHPYIFERLNKLRYTELMQEKVELEKNLELYNSPEPPPTGELSVKEQMEQEPEKFTPFQLTFTNERSNPKAIAKQKKAAAAKVKAEAKALKAKQRAEVAEAKAKAKAEKQRLKEEAKAAAAAAAATVAAAAAGAGAGAAVAGLGEAALEASVDAMLPPSDTNVEVVSEDTTTTTTTEFVDTAIIDLKEEEEEAANNVMDESSIITSEEDDFVSAAKSVAEKKKKSTKPKGSSSSLGRKLVTGTVVVAGGGIAYRIMQQKSAVAEEERQRQFKVLMGEFEDDDNATTTAGDKKKPDNPLDAIDVSSSLLDLDDPAADAAKAPKKDTPTNTDAPTPGVADPTTTATAKPPKKKKKKRGLSSMKAMFNRKTNNRESDLSKLVSADAKAPGLSRLLAQLLDFGAPGRFQQVAKLGAFGTTTKPMETFELNKAKDMLVQEMAKAQLTREDGAEVFANVVNCLLIELIDLAASSLKEKSDITHEAINIVIEFMNHAASLYDSVAGGIVLDPPVTYGGNLAKNKLEQMYGSYAYSASMKMEENAEQRMDLLRDVLSIPQKKAEGVMMRAMQKNIMEMMKDPEQMKAMQDMMTQQMGPEGMAQMEAMMAGGAGAGAGGGMPGMGDGEMPDMEQLTTMLQSVKQMKDSGQISSKDLDAVRKQFKDSFGQGLDDLVKQSEENPEGLDAKEKELVSLMKEIMA